ncbi:MAG TPA: cyclopropane-fatty-acyl-phospholipid synthase family protein [Verrucomicrobiae bacterium]|nr:cyclopropane-fatty-acyl-phospholipid synthase family protein [Verrucomicrobiae bacterium]
MLNTWLDHRLLKAIRERVRVPIYIGPAASSEDATPFSSAPAVRLRDRRTLYALLRNPQINFGDLYSDGSIEVEGDLVSLLEKLYERPQQTGMRLASRWLALFESNSLRGARKNIHHHYDIPADFYKLWLDPQLVYTCAYFSHRDATLEQAQDSKLDLVCRKVWLRPEETVVEAGCGWGALALYMAKHYGARVKAFNISREQIEFARDRAKREGLASRVEFIEDDYRNITGRFNVFASVGMLEHIGTENHVELGRVIHRTIGDHGRGILHFIGRNRPQPLSPWIRKRIFPGGHPPSLQEAMNVLEPQNFSVLDVENLRFHYARTVECWKERYERSYDCVEERFGPTFARMWRLYLAGSIAAFRAGTMQLFQLVFAGSKCAPLPLTREHLYDNSTETIRQDLECIPAMSL